MHHKRLRRFRVLTRQAMAIGRQEVRPFVERKLRYFAESPKDVLYPVVGMKMNFVEGSSNGILINKETFKEVGEFPEHKMQKAGVNDFELAKLFWATKAIECGCKFKGIVGLRII